MKTDITLSRGDKKLIIDTKYYGHTMANTDIIALRLYLVCYQIYTSIRIGSTGKVAGVLLCKTDEITPNNDFNIGGNRISIKPLI